MSPSGCRCGSEGEKERRGKGARGHPQGVRPHYVCSFGAPTSADVAGSLKACSLPTHTVEELTRIRVPNVGRDAMTVT